MRRLSRDLLFKINSLLRKIHIVVLVFPLLALGTSYSFLDHVIRYFYFNLCQDADRILYGIYLFLVSFTYLAGP